MVVSLLTLVALLAPVGLGAPDVALPKPEGPLFDRITEKARSLASRPYVPPDAIKLPPALADLNYDRHRDIRFKKSEALWRGQGHFSVEFFHTGFIYREPVVINEVVDRSIRPLAYDPSLFDYGRAARAPEGVGSHLGFAGFRIHYPLNRADYQDEVVAFLGASYFRMVGRGQGYGISARGLAIDTALPHGEEFPRFREFWLVRPAPQATTATFYALLDSKSVVGVYRFTLSPGADTVMDVEARLFARKDVQKLGMAPLTSMFLYGENRSRFVDDFRPEVHDSDGLLVQMGSGERIWRPLTNDGQLRVSSLLEEKLGGFGLAQRDRDFDNYLDLEARYERRPGFWVKPRHGDWSKGVVQLVEIPTRVETNDNIVAFWVPDRPFKAGEQRVFAYQLRTFASDVGEHGLATVKRTRIGGSTTAGARTAASRGPRQFTVDFAGGPLRKLAGSQPVTPDLTVSAGGVRDLGTQPLPDGGVRVAFRLAPAADKPSDMRLFLRVADRRVSETWNYVWQAHAPE